MTVNQNDGTEFSEKLQKEDKKVVLDRFVMLATERGQDADQYIRNIRDEK